MPDVLQDIALTGGAVEFRGALETIVTAAGVLPRRLPEWTRAQYPDASLEREVTAGSGVRLVFRSAATVIELDVLTTVTAWDGQPPRAGVFELVIDGAPESSRPAPVGNVTVIDDYLAAGSFVPGSSATVRFDGLPAVPKDVEIWLPQSHATELIALRADAPAFWATPSDRRIWLHHGSSISQCNEAESPLGTWPAIAARRTGVELVNVGLAGNCFLDPFVARTLHDTPADVISLKLGINLTNRAGFRLRTFGPAVHGFLDTVRDGHPDVPLTVVSPVACPATESTPGPAVWLDGVLTATGRPDDVAAGALTLQVVRRELERIVAARAKQDPNIHYLDGLRLLGLDETRYLAEGLHPTAAGYRLIGERFAELAVGLAG